jgi:hypothetical protein
MTESYRWRGGCEQLLRHGMGSKITLLVLPALFEEANRMRRFTISIMRNLAALGIETILPDLPGTGESLTELIDVQLQDWHDAVAALTDNCTGSIAIRGGALLDASSARRWRLAPETGERLLRDMARATAFSEGLPVHVVTDSARKSPTWLAGNLLNPQFFNALHEAAPSADAYVSTIAGPKLWRAAESSDDPMFTASCAQDIARWAEACGA